MVVSVVGVVVVVVLVVAVSVLEGVVIVVGGNAANYKTSNTSLIPNKNTKSVVLYLRHFDPGAAKTEYKYLGNMMCRRL